MRKGEIFVALAFWPHLCGLPPNLPIFLLSDLLFSLSSVQWVPFNSLNKWDTIGSRKGPGPYFKQTNDGRRNDSSRLRHSRNFCVVSTGKKYTSDSCFPACSKNLIDSNLPALFLLGNSFLGSGQQGAGRARTIVHTFGREGEIREAFTTSRKERSGGLSA